MSATIEERILEILQDWRNSAPSTHIQLADLFRQELAAALDEVEALHRNPDHVIWEAQHIQVEEKISEIRKRYGIVP